MAYKGLASLVKCRLWFRSTIKGGFNLFQRVQLSSQRFAASMISCKISSILSAFLNERQLASHRRIDRQASNGGQDEDEAEVEERSISEILSRAVNNSFAAAAAAAAAAVIAANRRQIAAEFLDWMERLQLQSRRPIFHRSPRRPLSSPFGCFGQLGASELARRQLGQSRPSWSEPSTSEPA